MKVDRRLPSLARKALVAGAVAAVLPVLAGCQRQTARAEPPPPTVGVVEARRADVPVRAEPNGTTRALQQVSIRARVRGFLTEQHFKEGSEVKKGLLLFVIDEAPYQASLDSAKARLAEAEASLARAKTSKAREVSAAQVAADQATLELNRIEERRKRALTARNAASPEDVDQAVANRKKSEAQVDSDRANADQARADYDVNIQAAEASVAAPPAAVRSAELDLG
jgi:membrane fusion protein (multidrug efflux system)